MKKISIKIQNMSSRKETKVYFADKTVATPDQVVIVPRAGSMTKEVEPHEYNFAKNRQREYNVVIKLI